MTEALNRLRAGAVFLAGLGVSTVLPDMDFETYSPAGFVWDASLQKWGCPIGAAKKGLPVVGVARYSEHPDTEVLSLAYDLKNGNGSKLWTPGNAPPFDLFDHILHGGLIEAWNSCFEHWIWNNVCVKKYGWPKLPIGQLRDAMAKSRAHALPGGLDAAGKVLNLKNKKDKVGKRLLDKFSKPRNPTKNDPRTRIVPRPGDPDSDLLYMYNVRDIEAEAEASGLTPDLSPDELEFWLCDQTINYRGVQIDLPGVYNCIKIVEQAHLKYNAELRQLTGGTVQTASEVQKIIKWTRSQGVPTATLDAHRIEELLGGHNIPDDMRRVLEIRSLLGSAAVKKLYAMANQATEAGRLHDLFIYHSARTGRAAGAGPQPQNLPNHGPDVVTCAFCKKMYNGDFCPWCGLPSFSMTDWDADAVHDALSVINTGSLDCVEYFYGEEAISAVSGCLRGLFISAPEKDLICSDYSAIEAVVLAALAGEQWRLDVFNTHGMIYEMSASKITGIPFAEYVAYKEKTGQHHPMRKKVGKVAELASGYQGWIGAWKQFGADEFFSDEEMKKSILAWRAASPAIVEMWGGQEKNWRPCYYGLEGAAISAVLNPGKEFSFRNTISYLVHQDVLYCKLLSGRYITYHKPRLNPSDRRGLSLSFEGWNTNPKNGAIGWVRINTYGGRLTENVVQASSRDVLAYAIVNLEKSGYPVVMHVHDEIVAEVPEGHGSIEEFESIMSTMPPWATGWPIRANGGWRGKRYRK